MFQTCVHFSREFVEQSLHWYLEFLVDGLIHALRFHLFNIFRHFAAERKKTKNLLTSWPSFRIQFFLAAKRGALGGGEMSSSAQDKKRKRTRESANEQRDVEEEQQFEEELEQLKEEDEMDFFKQRAAAALEAKDAASSDGEDEEDDVYVSDDEEEDASLGSAQLASASQSESTNYFGDEEEEEDDDDDDDDLVRVIESYSSLSAPSKEQQAGNEQQEESVPEKKKKKSIFDDVQHEDDSSEDENQVNTVGKIPLHWYEEYGHIGYDKDGNKIIRKPRKDALDHLLARHDDPNYLYVEQQLQYRTGQTSYCYPAWNHSCTNYINKLPLGFVKKNNLRCVQWPRSSLFKWGFTIYYWY